MPASKKKVKVEPVAEVKETPVEPVARPVMIIEPVVEEKPPVVVSVEPTVADLASVPTGEEKAEAEEEPKVKKGMGWGVLWIAIAFILGVGMGLGGGYLVWKGGIKLPKLFGAKPTPTAAVAKVTPTTAPSPTGVQDELSRTGFNIQVLNGSGVKGAAAKAKDYLESMGYSDVQTGNAEGEDYSKTVIEAKVGQAELFALLKADLGAKYTVDAVMGTLAASSVFDGVVIVGKK